MVVIWANLRNPCMVNEKEFCLAWLWCPTTPRTSTSKRVDSKLARWWASRCWPVPTESDSWMHVILWIWMFYSLQLWGLMPHWLLEPEPQNTADGKQSCNTPNLHPCLPKSLRWAQASCLIWAERSQTSRSKSKPLVHSLSPGPFTGISLPLLSQSSHSLSLKSSAKVICGTLWFLLTLFPGSCIGHSGCWGHRLPAEDLGSLLCGLNQVANLDRHACIRRVLCTVGCGGWMDT